MKWLIAFCALMMAAPVLAAENFSVDPDHVFIPKPVDGSATTWEEPVIGSDVPAQYYYVETWDSLYAPIAVRKPKGDGPFPIVLFTYGNGGFGLRWVREWTNYASGTLEEFVKHGYAVAWVRYRNEVDNGYRDLAPLTSRMQTGRVMHNRGILDYQDIMAMLDFVKTLPYVDPKKVGYVGMSHGGEMGLQIAGEYKGELAAMVASEPASIMFLARKPMPRPPGWTPGQQEAEPAVAPSADVQAKAVEAMRPRLDMDVAGPRIALIPDSLPIFVHGRDRDGNQPIFRLSHDLLKEAGKTVSWKSYDHAEHGFMHVKRNADGKYVPDAAQAEVVKDTIAFLDKYMK